MPNGVRPVRGEVAHAAGHSVLVSPSAFAWGRPSPETWPGGRLRGPRTPVDECRQCRGVGSPAQAADDPKVISDWNATAFDTIVVDAGKANAEAFMWFAFEQAAVYNAVVGITRRYELYNWNARGPRGASPQAAAAVAAHESCSTTSRRRRAGWNRAAASLAEIPDGPAKSRGSATASARRTGSSSSARTTADSRRSHSSPAGARRLAPDPARLRAILRPVAVAAAPLLLDSPSQFRPGPPPALTPGRTRTISTR